MVGQFLPAAFHGFSQSLSHRFASIDMEKIHVGYLLIRTIPKKAREEICVSPGVYKGHRRISIRVWAKTAGGAVPTKGGFGVTNEAAGGLTEAIKSTRDTAKMLWNEETMVRGRCHER
jgi:hypothetical protein